jgi:hypothetical protein
MKYAYLLVVVPLCFACGNSRSSEMESDAVTVNASAKGRSAENLPDIRFENEIHDFGKIAQGERVSHTFEFENTGKTALIISGASASCGCTVPGWPKEPIEPGKKSRIDVVFNSEGKNGYQEKTITVITNCEPATRILRIKADVVVPSPNS